MCSRRPTYRRCWRSCGCLVRTSSCSRREPVLDPRRGAGRAVDRRLRARQPGLEELARRRVAALPEPSCRVARHCGNADRRAAAASVSSCRLACAAGPRLRTAAAPVLCTPHRRAVAAASLVAGAMAAIGGTALRARLHDRVERRAGRGRARPLMRPGGEVSILRRSSRSAAAVAPARQRMLLVSPDTGVAHLAKLAGVPSVTLFRPGAAGSTVPEAAGPGMRNRRKREQSWRRRHLTSTSSRACGHSSAHATAPAAGATASPLERRARLLASPAECPETRATLARASYAADCPADVRGSCKRHAARRALRMRGMALGWRDRARCNASARAGARRNCRRGRPAAMRKACDGYNRGARFVRLSGRAPSLQ